MQYDAPYALIYVALDADRHYDITFIQIAGS